MGNVKFLKQLGPRIKTIRKTKGISQVELAARCGFVRASMSRIESGKANPTTLTLNKISNSLSVHISELFHQD